MRTSIFVTLLFSVLSAGCSSGDSTSAVVDQTLYVPTSITATRIGRTAVRIDWTDNNTVEEGYIVECQNGAGPFTQKLFTTRDVASAVDSLGLSVNVTYGYRVRAIRYQERGDYSPVVTIKLSLPYP
jgi:hypothetical protein